MKLEWWTGPGLCDENGQDESVPQSSECEILKTNEMLHFKGKNGGNKSNVADYENKKI